MHQKALRKEKAWVLFGNTLNLQFVCKPLLWIISDKWIIKKEQDGKEYLVSCDLIWYF